jgi:hypothetical protein
VFVGFETPDEEGLAEHRGHRTPNVDVAGTVATLTPHVMIVNDGFIRGIDGEGSPPSPTACSPSSRKRASAWRWRDASGAAQNRPGEAPGA